MMAIADHIMMEVAPVRERGLKCQFLRVLAGLVCRRSRKGAWIEICDGSLINEYLDCRSRKGAWIEICRLVYIGATDTVAPVRERGLKCSVLRQCYDWFRSLP